MENSGSLYRVLPFFLSIAVSLTASATTSTQTATAVLLDGRTLSPVSESNVIQNVQPGSVLILGENHGIAGHRDQHLILLNLLRDKGLKVSVGMEFINYPDQIFLDQYTGQELNDEQFLKLINWNGFPFEFYKQQILFPRVLDGEKTLGLNVPRSVTSKIAKTGLESLTAAERNLLPVDFQVGRDSYKARFANLIHVPVGPVLDRYFTAQSAWDDTMAYQGVQFLNSNPGHVLVIIVGEFHAQFGGGLADRIRSRRPDISITTLSQLWAVKNLEDGTQVSLSEEEIKEQIQPSPTEGSRGDFIWITKP